MSHRLAVFTYYTFPSPKTKYFTRNILENRKTNDLSHIPPIFDIIYELGLIRYVSMSSKNCLMETTDLFKS
jgi:hypothetical protein